MNECGLGIMPMSSIARNVPFCIHDFAESGKIIQRKSGDFMRLYSLPLLLLWCMFGACQSHEAGERRSFEIKGTVVSVDQTKGQVTLAHEEIPGFMGAMTMPFKVKDGWALPVLAPGQRVQATLVVSSGLSWIESLVITQQPISGGIAGSVADSADPVPGTPVPDITLTDQDGKKLRFRDFRGRALLLTFIYTRCPLPDYCVKMSSNFAVIATSLLNDRMLSERVRLLSISFDPDFDKPEVLREYAKAYLETQWPDALRIWSFASGTREQVQAAAHFFGLQYWQGSGQIVHSLRTVLIGPDGKVDRLYPGNEWTPEQVLQDLRALSLP